MAEWWEARRSRRSSTRTTPRFIAISGASLLERRRMIFRWKRSFAPSAPVDRRPWIRICAPGSSQSPPASVETICGGSGGGRPRRPGATSGHSPPSRQPAPGLHHAEVPRSRLRRHRGEPRLLDGRGADPCVRRLAQNSSRVQCTCELTERRMGERDRRGGRSERKPDRRLSEASGRLVSLRVDHARRASGRHRRRSSLPACPNPAGGGLVREDPPAVTFR